MKVVAIAHYYIEENRAGGEMMLHALLRALANEGHDVSCLVTDTLRQNSVIDGVKVFYASNYRHLETFPSDIIISHFQNASMALNYATRSKKPYVYIVHNDMPHTMMMAKHIPSGLLVFNTEWISSKVKSIADRIVIHPPVNKPVVPQNDPEGYITLVNLIPEKGADIFYELAKNNPHRKFLAVKGGYFKNRQVLANLPNVKIIEMTSDMQNDVYAKSRIVLMPSSYESFGMVSAEAMANAIPVIVNSTAGLRENVGNAGLYGRLDDIETWQEKIELLDDKDTYKKYQDAVLARSKMIDENEELKSFVKKIEGLCAESKN